MNNETLDALLIDRALGALPPDTEALLAAYMVQHHGRAADLERTLNAVGLVRNALKEEGSAPLPDFRAPRTVRQQKQHRYTLQAAGMAAMLAIGLTFGRYLFDAPNNLQTHPIDVAVITEPTPIAQNGIWSITPARLERKAARASRWKWNSPVHQPERLNY